MFNERSSSRVERVEKLLREADEFYECGLLLTLYFSRSSSVTWTFNPFRDLSKVRVCEFFFSIRGYNGEKLPSAVVYRVLWIKIVWIGLWGFMTFTRYLDLCLSNRGSFFGKFYFCLESM